MAVHKVPQDVEADDKFLGPLSFKQFLFAGGTIIFGYLSFLTISNGAALLSPIFIIPALGFGALAFPWSKEQPTELWLASRIRFFIKPRRRIWDQTGMKDLVNITAPQQVAHALTDGLTQAQVRDRFGALANMVDSRGWAVKNVQGGGFTNKQSDRLVEGTNAPSPTATIVSDDTTDVLDERRGSVAQNFDTLIQKSEEEQKAATRELIERARNGQPPAQAEPPTDPQQTPTTPPPQTQPTQQQPQQDDQYNLWFNNAQAASQQVSSPLQQPQQTAVQTVQPQQDMIDREHAEQAAAFAEAHVVQEHAKKQEPKEVTEQPNPDILNLSRSNDLNVDVLSRQANKSDDDGEVVISLH